MIGRTPIMNARCNPVRGRYGQRSNWWIRRALGVPIEGEKKRINGCSSVCPLLNWKFRLKCTLLMLTVCHCVRSVSDGWEGPHFPITRGSWSWSTATFGYEPNSTGEVNSVSGESSPSASSALDRERGIHRERERSLRLQMNHRVFDREIICIITWHITFAWPTKR